MLAESVKNMTNRSIPRPNPPVGGRPYSRLHKPSNKLPSVLHKMRHDITSVDSILTRS
jgi:hypothetical protein